MKFMTFAIPAMAVPAMLVAAPLCAQTMPAPAATPVPTTPADPAMATGAKFSLDTPIEAIVADPAGKAVIDADFPGMTAHPMYEMFKSMSLAQVQPQSQGQITEAQLAKAKTDLATVK